MDEAQRLIERDARVSWHPYTQHATEVAPLPVRSAQGARLELMDGRTVLDGISSWWAILHGHGEPRLVEAARSQLETLDHVLFAGCTHEGAVQLAEKLVERAPGPFERCFFSDNGSTAVEVALKMVVAAWRNRGEPQRRTFVGLEGSYHGDTFGAMAIGDPDPFFVPFEPMLFEARRAPVDLDSIESLLDELGERAAGVILEPRVQGAAGMCMHSDEFLRGVRAACDARGLPLIADEVMTGFGRTGDLFACAGAGIEPDYLCLAKGLTGGIFPLSATLARGETFRDFWDQDRGKAFFHGHTFTAHPVGCAIALESLKIVDERGVPARLDAIGAHVEATLRGAAPQWSDRVRRRGGIVAMDLPVAEGQQGGYLADLAPRLRAAAIERGVLLRPLGPVLYALPPACTSDEEAERIGIVMAELAVLATE